MRTIGYLRSSNMCFNYNDVESDFVILCVFWELVIVIYHMVWLIHYMNSWWVRQVYIHFLGDHCLLRTQRKSIAEPNINDDAIYLKEGMLLSWGEENTPPCKENDHYSTVCFIIHKQSAILFATCFWEVPVRLANIVGIVYTVRQISWEHSQKLQ